MKRPELESGSPTLTQLPETVLHTCFSLLSAQDLAALSLQDKYLRAVAADAGLWQPLALARWPGAAPTCAEAYAGDWHALFLARAPLPHGFPLAADRVRAVTDAQRQQRQQEAAAAAAAAAAEEQGIVSDRSGSGATSSSSGSRVCGGPGLPALAFEDVMRQTFSAGLACSRDRSVRRTPEWRRLKEDLTWWATERPEVVVAFVRSAHDVLAGGWGGAAAGRSWRETPWRRSALAFLQDLGLLGGAHMSVADRIAAEAAALDRAIRTIQKEAAAAVEVPAGVPASHWWFG
ncbi:hypothetical protein COHA_007475 [Chlorella ohadii]|uniref:F-box domain-containing protein n=1 Tax=Chlorella ohadii TaxID=2649997 RepID=A0AAD5H445_9CHLO|nr:hypothetical protein COHA_007475 [Chlorella ohadii]